MHRRGWFTLLACLAGHAVGCGDDGHAMTCADFVAPDAGGELPPQVAEVLEQYCWECHGQPIAGYAPMALIHWADFQACRSEGQQVPVYERMRIRINDKRLPMPPITKTQLSPEDRMILDTWASESAPAAD